jgi:lysophospholipid acyltransferase (LPLAT)-like uncharacterized protein
VAGVEALGEGSLRVRLLSWVIAAAVRVWVLTLRIRVESTSGMVGSGPRVFAFWHGQQMALLAAGRPRETTVLVSHSADGEVSAGVMSTLGLRVVRGSSSRGGARALAELVRALRRGASIALAVDGPRGPVHVAKPGAAAAARAGAAELVPVAAAAARVLVLRRAWDEFEIPLPFTRVAVVTGRAVCASDAKRCPDLLGRAIDEARNTAVALLAAGAPAP